MNKEILFFGFILTALYSEMSMKLLIGFGSGLYVATVYDVKPLVKYVEVQVYTKINEAKEILDTYEKNPKKFSNETPEIPKKGWF